MTEKNKNDWTTNCLESLGLTDSTSAQDIFNVTDQHSTNMAPDNRKSWRLLVILEALAITLPLSWFMTTKQYWEPSVIAVLVLLFTVFMVGFIWWIRWRALRTNWIQLRLLAEVTRSYLHSRHFNKELTLKVVEGHPDLEHFAQHLIQDTTDDTQDIKNKNIDEYIEHRLSDQLSYYQSKYDQAQQKRLKLSRYITWAMDASVFFAVAGLVLVFGDSSERLFRLTGAGLFLGLIGCTLPLVAVLIQKLGSFLELDRRTGKYAQQMQILGHLKSKLLAAPNPSQAEIIIYEIEHALVSEVIDWYYEAKNSEIYYRLKKRADKKNRPIDGISTEDITPTVKGKIFSNISTPLTFLFKLIFDRILVVAASFIITTAGIAYVTPEDAEQLSTLRLIDGRILSSADAKGWFIDESAQNGVIFIAHGLHDGVSSEIDAQGNPHWMAVLQKRLQSKTQGYQPNIALIDWKNLARPSKTSLLGIDTEDFESGTFSMLEMLQDVSAIRPSAEDLGELVGYKIAQKIARGEIRQDKPMHFIGHSAGGFLVTRAAQVLHDLGLASKDTTITILDTPVAVTDDLLRAAEFAQVDFYVTSLLAEGTPDSNLHPNYTLFEIPTPPDIDLFIQAHSYATDWYTDSIGNAELPGFSRSPFAQPPGDNIEENNTEGNVVDNE
ncbi:hypothetical protein [Glaciecola sp. 1036]|uniref:hypothetical protein n=1 Tax=Alteromonadaceae TaxID=72275 RepID=UPI003D015F2F